MSDAIPEATWEGEINIAGVTIRCYVLDNGMRIFNADDIEKFFNSAIEPTQDECEKLALFAKGLSELATTDRNTQGN